jgi:hypothetical protein
MAANSDADCPDGIAISVLRTGDNWEFRTAADEATRRIKALKPRF